MTNFQRTCTSMFFGFLSTLFLGACGPGAAPGDIADEPPDAAVQAQVKGRDLVCEVAILGGGAGGLHTAYRLGPKLGDKVCLFEKEERLGGRIYDVSKAAGGPLIGVGARRVMENQTLLFALAKELDMKLEEAPWQDDLINARGVYGLKSDDMLSAYPKLKAGQTEESIYNLLRTSPERARAHEYPDYRAYIRAVAGEQAYHFLLDMSRFRADFEYPIDARGYLDYLDEEWDACCKPSYPVGGMSEFIRRMAAKAEESGVRIFTGEAIQEIAGKGKTFYALRTSKHRVFAKRLVVAIDPEGLKHVQGSIAAKIKQAPQFDDILPIRVATITQWWPRAWWQESHARGANVKRAWSTDECLNHIEIPVDAYGTAQLVTRSVYDDDQRCVDFWENTAKKSPHQVEEEIERGLKALFPDISIPKADKTFMHVWPAAWYWLRAGSRFTNADVADWALNPLAGENISLVSEAYYLNRSGWSEAAYKSSIRTLNAHFGMSLETHTKLVPFNVKRTSTRKSLGQGGH